MTSDIALFLIGSIFPLYCAGYAGLIHIARTDPKLYGVIEAYAGRLVFYLLSGVAACAAGFILADWLNDERDWTLFFIAVPPVLLMGHARYSRSLFRTITELPPSENPVSEKRHEGDKNEG